MKKSSEKSAEKPEVIVIGGAAGSVRFLLSLAPALGTDLGIPFLVVIHRMRNEESRLGQILDYRLDLPVKEADEKDEIRPGVMYVAPPDYHLLVEDDRTLTLVDMELVKYSRPSIDVTYTSVSEVYGSAAVAILLSGANDDGTSGLAAIAHAGGRAIAQDPAASEVDTMPKSSIEVVEECEVMGRKEMMAYLNSLRSVASRTGGHPA